MEIYLEVLKRIESEEEELYELPQGFTKKVSSEEEAMELYKKLKRLGVFEELRPYTARIHYHGHSPKGNKGCEVKIIEEVE